MATTLRGVVQLDRRDAMRGFRELDRESRKLTRTPLKVKVGLDVASKGRVKKELGEIFKLGKSQKITIETKVVDRGGLKALVKLNAELKKLGRNPRVTITITTSNQGKGNARSAADEAIREGRRAERERIRSLDRELREVIRVRREEARIRGQRISDGRAAAGQLGDRASTNATYAGMAIAGGLIASTKAAVDFEDAFAGVRKTVKENDQVLDGLALKIRKMGTEIPVTTTELSKIAQIGGQLGISVPNLAKFTDVVAKLGVATNLTSETGSLDLARLAGITRMSQKDFDRLGSTVVDLGNNFKTTEREVVQIGKRFAPMGNQMGVSLQHILGYSAALSSMGVPAEAAGSSISTAFDKINKYVSEGGDKLKLVADVAGTTAKVFKEKFGKDSSGAMRDFIAGLGTVKERGGDTTKVIRDLGLNNIRVRQTLLALAGDVTVLDAALKHSDTAWKENTALNREAAIKFGTLSSQLKIAAGKANEVGITVGLTLVPALSKALDRVDKAFKYWQSLDKATQSNIVSTAVWSAGILLAAGRIKALVETIVLARTAYIGLRTAIIAAGGASVIAGQMMTFALGPVGLAIIGITAAVALGVVGWKGYGDAGSMSADRLIKKWGTLGKIWDQAGRGLGRIFNYFNGSKATFDATTDKQLAIINAGRKKKGLKPLTRDEYQGDPDADLDSPAPKPVTPKPKQKLGVTTKPTGNPPKPKPKPFNQNSGGDSGIGINFARVSGSRDDRIAGLQQQFEQLNQLIDNRVISGLATKGDGLLKAWRAKRTQVSHELSALKRESSEASRVLKAQIKTEKDALTDLASAYEKRAKGIQDLAKTQIDELTGVRDSMRGIFSDIQGQFVQLGVINNPLGPIIKKFESMLNIGGRSNSIVSKARGEYDIFTGKANAARSRAEILGGNDGYVADENGSIVGAGKAAGGTLVSNLVKEFNSRSPKALGASCADVASNVLNQIGNNLKYSANARQLMNNAKAAGWVMVPLGTAGALHVQTGTGFGKVSRAHTTVGIGKGRVAGSSGYKYQEYDIRKAGGHPIALAPKDYIAPTGAVGVKRKGKLESALTRDALKNGENTLDVTGISGVLSSINAVDLGWGKAVKNIESNSIRFMLQTQLAADESKKWIDEIAVGLSKPAFKKDLDELNKKLGTNFTIHGGGRYAANDFLRQVGNYADSRLNADKANDEKSANLREIEKGVTEARVGIKGLVTDADVEIKNSRTKRIQLSDEAGDLSKVDLTSLLAAKATSNWAEDAIARFNKLREITNSPEIRALIKGGRIGEAKNTIAGLMGRYDGQVGIDRQNAVFSDLANKNKESSEKSSESLKEFNQKTKDLNWAVSSAADRLNSLLANPNATSSELRDEVSGLDAGVRHNFRLKNLLAATKTEALSRSGAESIGLPDLLENARSMRSDYAQQVIDAREAGLPNGERVRLQNLREISAIEAKIAGLKNVSSADQAKMNAQLGEYKIIMAGVVKDAQDADKIGLRDTRRTDWVRELGEIKRVGIDTTTWMQRGFEAFENSASDSFSSILNKEKSFGTALRDSVMNTLGSIADSVIQQGLSSLLSGALFGALGGGTSNFAGQGAGPWAGGYTMPGHAAGLDRVPRDNYVARLHSGEAVLSAVQAKRYREERAANLTNAKSSSSGSSRGQVLVVQYVHNGDVVANSPEEYQDKLKQNARRGGGRQPKARGEYSREIRVAASGT